ncbi:MAG TPA: hypothetical protein VEF76_07230 [Patescibacteria group bacterium]|nr:hypothetical protein [Patescibacteria group bacterium]
MARRFSEEEYICQDCGHLGRAEVTLRGSAGLERFLWYALLIPGPFYSWWRRRGKTLTCAKCRVGYIVPADSKLGEVMLENKLRGRAPAARKPIPRRN